MGELIFFTKLKQSVFSSFLIDLVSTALKKKPEWKLCQKKQNRGTKKNRGKKPKVSGAKIYFRVPYPHLSLYNNGISFDFCFFYHYFKITSRTNDLQRTFSLVL